MTRKEVCAFYEDLKKTGKFEDFRNKHPREMTKKELDLFYYDDGEYMYDPFEGSLGKVSPSTEYGPNTGLSYDKLKAIGMLRGMKTKSWSELSDEEQKLFSDDSI